MRMSVKSQHPTLSSEIHAVELINISKSVIDAPEKIKTGTKSKIWELGCQRSLVNTSR